MNPSYRSFGHSRSLKIATAPFYEQQKILDMTMSFKACPHLLFPPTDSENNNETVSVLINH